MRIFEPTVEIINQKNDFISIMKHIELIGREAYKSQENITDDSYIKFNKHLINNEHYSVLEHGTIYLKTNNGSVINKYSLNKYNSCSNPFNLLIYNSYSIIYFLKYSFSFILSFNYKLTYLFSSTS